MLLFEKDLPENVDYLELFHSFCDMGKNINTNYIYDLLCGANSKIVLYNIDNSYIDIQNCPCGLIYKVRKTENTICVVITFIATKYKCRKVGYASLFLNSFIEFVKENYSKKYGNIIIVLDSVIEAVTFYEHIGFKWIVSEKYNELLDISEEDENDIEHFVMEYVM
jgi:GNAT superfamily N-acetyltransferase